jgi:hypothetical protein
MHEDRIREHIEAAAARPERETRLLTARIASFCWPGGSDDRSEPGALAWVRRWRPATAGAALPVCSCALGNCAVCN